MQPAYRESLADLLDYNYIRSKVLTGDIVERTYKKTDGTTQNLRTLLWDFFLHCCSKFCMVILFPAFRSLLYGEI